MVMETIPRPRPSKSRPLQTYLRRTLDLADEMKRLADEGEAEACDDSCAVLFGVVRDCAYKIESRAASEVVRHRAAG